jgi:ATP-dependent RNA helicase RhlE
VDIVVATPGRLLDLTQQGLMHYDAIEHFVLDEADRMLDMGFINDIRKIIAMLPKQRQTLFFSATISSEIRELSRSMLINPVHLNVEPEVETPALGPNLTICGSRKTNGPAQAPFRTEDIEHALVFTRTQATEQTSVESKTREMRFYAAAIHGITKKCPEKALYAFKSKTILVLVATDISFPAGLDVDS